MQDDAPRAGRLAKSALALGIVVAGALLAGDAEPPPTLINADFEQFRNGVPFGWALEPAAPFAGEFEAIALGGNRSLRLRPNRDEPRVRQLFDARPFLGGPLFVSARMRTEGAAVGIVRLEIHFASGEPSEVVELRSPDDGGEPRLVEAGVWVRDRPEPALAVIACSARGASGAAYFDDIAVSADPKTATSPYRPALRSAMIEALEPENDSP